MINNLTPKAYLNSLESWLTLQESLGATTSRKERLLAMLACDIAKYRTIGNQKALAIVEAALREVSNDVAKH